MGGLLVLNAGSSSIKFSLYDASGNATLLRLRGRVDGLHWRPGFKVRDGDGATLDEHVWPEDAHLDHDAALDHILDWLTRHYGATLQIDAAAHRVVHGGARFTAAVRVDDEVLDALARLAPFAPLHQPHNLAIIGALRRRWPQVPQVACFDTAFHRTQPPLAQRIALPDEYVDEGLRRYGFHGLSYAYIASVLPEIDRRAAEGRTIVLHLGNGASMCALLRGRSIATTMGFSTLDGLVMSTRCGSIDPGALLYLMQQRGMDAEALQALLYHRSGLLGVSGFASDMRALEASDDPRAKEAVDLFVYRIGRELGSLAAALGGVDALVFTAGIGEHRASIRSRVCKDAAWLGVQLDAALNQTGGPRLHASGSRVAAWVIPTDEELMMAREALAVLGD